MGDEAIDRNPDLELAQKRFLLTLDPQAIKDGPAKQEQAKAELLEAIKKDNMLPLYKALVSQFGWTPDQGLINDMQKAIDAKLEQQTATIKDAVENLGESEVREGFLARAEYLCRIGDKEKAVTAFRETEEKTVGLGQKLDIVFALIRLGFFYNDHDLIVRNIEKAKKMIEQGGDWDRRNRLKVYEGVYFMSVRRFKEAADLFLEGLATFTSEELFSYNTFIFYTVLVSMVSLNRVRLKEKVIDSPEVLGVIGQLGKLESFLNSLYLSNYSTFFSAMTYVMEDIATDRYMAPHAKYFCREMRIVAYSQLLDSYRSVRLDSMARDFGVSVDFLDRELSRFIASGRLHCKIDKVGGVVETTRPDNKNAQYNAVIKHGDILLNRVSKLSRIINL